MSQMILEYDGKVQVAYFENAFCDLSIFKVAVLLSNQHFLATACNTSSCFMSTPRSRHFCLI
jgi:hypothetical protein